MLDLLVHGSILARVGASSKPGAIHFAIGALLRWYKDGADVQVKLPKLSMYMGHVSILSTAHYLRWTPALAQAASEQFEVGFGSLIDGGTS
ncbi:hypothetical protein KAF44_24940 (plasmid) [Cupriavidus necator]|nr:hypothetical protein KAF44_22155 [Cupriavidus necator]UIF88005.1 hypothetical protein KAF44_22350 [Cupriavidus necator]UIF88568.1 hypothetical protein KAF44_24940 [Cupriavidus necator]